MLIIINGFYYWTVVLLVCSFLFVLWNKSVVLHICKEVELHVNELTEDWQGDQPLARTRSDTWKSDSTNVHKDAENGEEPGRQVTSTERLQLPAGQSWYPGDADIQSVLRYMGVYCAEKGLIQGPSRWVSKLCVPQLSARKSERGTMKLLPMRGCPGHFSSSTGPTWRETWPV